MNDPTETFMLLFGGRTDAYGTWEGGSNKSPVSYETFAKRERGGFMGIEASPGRFDLKWLRAETTIQGLYQTGQDVATDGVIGALAGGVIAASAYLQRDLLTEIRTSA